MDFQKPDNEQASEIAALKEQMAAKELSWEQEKQKIMKALKSERERRKIALADKKTKVMEMEESPNQDSPAEEVQGQDHQQTLSRQLQDLRTAQLDPQKPDKQLASENAALKEQMATKELSWEQERQQMMKALVSERESVGKRQRRTRTSQKEKDEIISSVRQSLLEKQNELELVNSQWSAKFNQVVESLNEENNTFKKNCVKKAHHVIFGLDKKNVMDLNAKLLVREKENVTELKTQQENFEKKLSQSILDLESYTTRKDSELIRGEAEWKIKLTALEDRMRCDLAAKEEGFQREQELQRQSREMEEERCNQKEEEIKLPTQQNAELQVHDLSLQELAQQTDKEKAQFKKEEKKARKEAEKMLEKDRKEEGEREKKERKEKEKRQKEELKRQKKEKKLLEKKEKGRK